ncbi:polyphosphate kinase 2 family protein [Paraburkholderia diazotrophica]|uniref:hypothetical protein n=1 Tax=Paraburkholderia diazotrophica TaxID=667676 RepID=UPI0038993940
MTERVRPGVSRVVALLAATDRVKLQMHMQRYSGGTEIVPLDRNWYTGAGAERLIGFCTEA